MSRKKKQNISAEDSFMKNKQKRKEKAKKSNSYLKAASKVLIIILVIILALALCAGAFYLYVKNTRPDSSGENSSSELYDQSITTHIIDNNTGEKNSLSKGKYSFLAIGTDKSESLTDVIIIATYDVTNKKIALMQIPRDTYVKVSGSLITDKNGSISKDNFVSDASYDMKLNTVYSHGRKFFDKEFNDLLSECVGKTDSEIQKICRNSCLSVTPQIIKEYNGISHQGKKNEMFNNLRNSFGMKYLSILLYHNFGVPIDYYAKVNISGFRNIVDVIGGVDVVIQDDMDYDDPLQDLHIHLKKGPQHLNGEKAEQFVRFRYGYVQADIARMDAQKIFITAFIKKLLSLETVSKYDDIVMEIQKNLATNLNFSDTLYFATNILDVDLSKIVMLTMPGKPQYVGNISYYLPLKDAIMETVNTHFNKYDKPLTKQSFCFEELVSGELKVDTMTADGISSQNPSLDFWNSASVSVPTEQETPDVLQEPYVNLGDDGDIKDVPTDDGTTSSIYDNESTPSVENPEKSDSSGDNGDESTQAQDSQDEASESDFDEASGSDNSNAIIDSLLQEQDAMQNNSEDNETQSSDNADSVNPEDLAQNLQ